MATDILTPSLRFCDFISHLSEGADLLARMAGRFADARLDGVRVVRHLLDEAGQIQTRDGFFFGLGLRVFGRGGCGFVVTEGRPQWKKALSRASALADAAVSGEGSGLSLASADPLEVTQLSDNGVPLVTPQQLEEVVHLVRETIPQAESIRIRYLARAGWRGVINTEGTRAIRSLAYSSLSVTCVVRSGEGRLVPLPITDRTVGPDDVVQKVLSQLGEARKLADQLATAETLRPMLCPVVLGPALTGLLIHEAFGHLCEADRIPPCGISALPRGRVIGPNELEVWDRADVPAACGSMPFDDEGVRCRSVPLIQGGRWIGLLHSRTTAALHREPPTGNARVTSFRHMPLCRLRLTEVKPGSHDPISLLAGISDGAYLDIPHGGHIRGARFRLGAIIAQRIVHGQLASSFAGAVLEGDPLVILNKIEAIGSDQMLTDRSGECSREDQRDLPVSTSAPSIRLREASLHPL